MTALEKFIKQIVLKQVKGSVYLVPAICDFQITEALEEEKKQGQTLPIQIVSESLPIEEAVFKKKFPEEEFDIDDYYEWVAENEGEAYKLVIEIINAR